MYNALTRLSGVRTHSLAHRRTSSCGAWWRRTARKSGRSWPKRSRGARARAAACGAWRWRGAERGGGREVRRPHTSTHTDGLSSLSPHCATPKQLVEPPQPGRQEGLLLGVGGRRDHQGARVGRSLLFSRCAARTHLAPAPSLEATGARARPFDLKFEAPVAQCAIAAGPSRSQWWERASFARACYSSSDRVDCPSRAYTPQTTGARHQRQQVVG